MTAGPALALQPEQIEFFRTRGYLAIDAITTAGELRWLREVYQEILDDRGTLRLDFEDNPEGAAQGIITQIFSPERQCPKLLESAYLTNAQALAAALLGTEPEAAVFGGLMMIYKPAAGGRDVPWHQDEAYWEFAERCHSLSVWMPLDDVTVDSGCMQFVPGSHRLEVLRYRREPGPDPQPLLLDEPVDLSGAAACPLAPGGATFHHCRTLHHTAGNRSPRPRRAFTAIFHGPRTSRSEPLLRSWLAKR